MAKEQRSMLKIILKNRVEKGRPASTYLQQHAQQHLRNQHGQPPSHTYFLPSFLKCLSLPINIFLSLIFSFFFFWWGVSDGSNGKESTFNAGDLGSNPWRRDCNNSYFHFPFTLFILPYTFTGYKLN